MQRSYKAVGGVGIDEVEQHIYMQMRPITNAKKKCVHWPKCLGRGEAWRGEGRKGMQM